MYFCITMSRGEQRSRRGKQISTETSEVSDAYQQRMVDIQDSLRSITGKLDNIGTLQQSVTTLQQDLWDEDGLDERIKYIGQQNEDSREDIDALKSENSFLRKEMQVMKSIIINLDRRVTQQENEIVDLRGRSMRDNILIHNLKEEENENLDTKVIGLIKAHMNLDVEFIRIHRNGPKHPGNPKPRIITGKLKNYNDKEHILQVMRQLREDKNSSLPFTITPQTPQQIHENKKKTQDLNYKYRTDKVMTKITGNKLVFPNGNVYRDKVQEPRAEDLLTMKEEEVKKLEDITVYATESVSEGGNSFKAIASQVSSYAQVRNFYRRVLRDPEYASANHNILVYRFTGSEGLVHDGYQDNGEYGAGRRILKELCDQNVSNAVVIVSRINGKHLGPRRFQIMKDIATSTAGML